MSVPVSAQGTLMQIGDGGGPEVFTTIARVLDITGPGLTTEVEDVTTHDTSGWRDRLATILDAGDVTFDIFYISANATHAALKADFLARTRRNFKIVKTDGEEIDFAAYITSMEMSMPIAAAYRSSITLGVSGAVTFS